MRADGFIDGPGSIKEETEGTQRGENLWGAAWAQTSKWGSTHS